MEFIKGFLQLVFDFVFYLIPQKKPSLEKLSAAKIVCHRGWHNNEDIKENTLKSFEMALEHQMWGIEFDIRWTKDLVPVVHHDPSCFRVWERDILISDVNFEELRKQIPEIPSLKEVVEKFGKKIHFFVEIKKEFYPHADKQKEILKKTLLNLMPQIDYHFFCLETGPLHIFDIVNVKTNLLVANFNLIEMSRLAMVNHYGGVSGHYVLTTSEMIKKHQDNGQKVGVGFIRSKNSLYREINRGADFIFTNHPWALINL